MRTATNILNGLWLGSMAWLAIAAIASKGFGNAWQESTIAVLVFRILVIEWGIRADKDRAEWIRNFRKR